jgi:hypothetical protein
MINYVGNEKATPREYTIDWSSPERQDFLDQLQEIADLLAKGYKFKEYQKFNNKEEGSQLQESWQTILIKESEKDAGPISKTINCKFAFPFVIRDTDKTKPETDFITALKSFKEDLSKKKS